VVPDFKEIGSGIRCCKQSNTYHQLRREANTKSLGAHRCRLPYIFLARPRQPGMK